MKPYYERDGITIYCGETLETMAQLDGPFDAIIADLPYGTTACSWDTVIPFEPLWEQYKRLTTGAVVLFGSQPFTSKLVMSCIEWFKYCWVWSKGTASNFQLANKNPLREHEDIPVFYNGKVTYNPQMVKKDKPIDKRKWNLKDRRKDALGHFGSPRDAGRKVLTHSYPRTIIPFSACAGDANGIHRLHPTQKPVALLAYLVRTYTNPGEIILDNTMGSGTTLVAAQQEGRRAVGIEISEEYCQIAVERLRQRSLWQIPQVENEKKNPQQEEMKL